MNLDQIVRAYVNKYPIPTHKELAEIILASEKSVNKSVRTLRRLVSKYRREKAHEVQAEGVPEILTYKGRRSLRSLADAVEYFEIDLAKYKISEFTCNSWDVTNKKGKTYTNYQVKVKLLPHPVIPDLDQLYKSVERLVSTPHYSRSYKGEGVSVVALTDLHLGAKVSGLSKTQDYSFDIAIDRLRTIADYVNSKNLREVYLFFVGDMIESFTGMNHPTSWQELEDEGYGSHVLKIAHKIFVDFFKRVKNLKGFFMVSGNHDRVGLKQENDPEGMAADLLHYMLKLTFPSLESEYQSMVLTKDIGNMRYILAHDHTAVSRDVLSLLWKYGDQSKYNIVLTGHWHRLKGKRVFHKIEEYGFDEFNFRSVCLPPIFTGNRHSESLGFTSRAGFYFDEHIDDFVPDAFIKSLK